MPYLSHEDARETLDESTAAWVADGLITDGQREQILRRTAAPPLVERGAGRRQSLAVEALGHLGADTEV